MKISIIIPSFNQGQFIRETVESCLSQDHEDFEVIIEDGGSSDSTVSYLEGLNDPRVLWRSERDHGVVDAVNKGLARARGDIHAIQSSDDVYLPGAFTVLVDHFRLNPRVGMIYGDVELIDEHSNTIGFDRQLGSFSLHEYLGRFIYIPQPSAFFRKHCVEVVGNWREKVSYVADADFWLRVACAFPVLHVPRTIGRYRYHEGQRDVHKERILRDWEIAIDDLIFGSQLSSLDVRFARMGKYLARYRYTPGEMWMRKSVALYRAAIACPSSVFDRRFPKRHLIPGRDPIWGFLSRMKHRLRSATGKLGNL